MVVAVLHKELGMPGIRKLSDAARMDYLHAVCPATREITARKLEELST
jgi:hypothetical protein